MNWVPVQPAASLPDPMLTACERCFKNTASNLTAPTLNKKLGSHLFAMHLLDVSNGGAPDHRLVLAFDYSLWRDPSTHETRNNGWSIHIGSDLDPNQLPAGLALQDIYDKVKDECRLSWIYYAHVDTLHLVMKKDQPLDNTVLADQLHQKVLDEIQNREAYPSERRATLQVPFIPTMRRR